MNRIINVKIVAIGVLASFILVIAYGLLIASNSVLFNFWVTGKCLATWDRKAFEAGNGWLFFRADLWEIIHPWSSTRNNIRKIIALNDSLAEKGCKLLVVWVPDKEAVIQAYSPFKVDNTSNQRKAVIRNFRKNGISVVDAYSSFQAAKDKESLYQKKDTHWDAPGIAITGRLIADTINRIFGRRGDALFSYKDTCILNTRDLAAKFLHDTTFYPNSCRMIIALDGDRFRDSVWSDIMIFGDSYATVNRAFGGGIGAQVSYYTGRPTFTYAHIQASAKGPAAILEFLKNRRKTPKIIIWIFVSRSFMDRWE